MSDKVHAGHLSKSSKELFRDGFKAFKEALKGAEASFSQKSSLEAEASELLGHAAPSLAELPKILFKLSQSTTVGAALMSATGSELMANNAFNNLIKSGGSAGGAAVNPGNLKKSPQGDAIDAPWLRANKSKKAFFERLYCSESESTGQYLDFYCQPLLAAGGELEGVFTLVSDSSQEVSRQEKLKELVGGVEGHISTLKQATDELTQFLKSQGQTGAVPMSAADDESLSAEPGQTAEQEEQHNVSQTDTQAETAEESTQTPASPSSPAGDENDEENEIKAREEAAAQLRAEAEAKMKAEEAEAAEQARVDAEARAKAEEQTKAKAEEHSQSQGHSQHSSRFSRLRQTSHSQAQLSDAPDPILALQTNNSASDDNDFDPAELQMAVESASAFILDQESASGSFPEAEVDDGPEDLWQEMSDGLADVLNVEDSEAAKAQDINLTILEEKPSKSRRVYADKSIEPVFKDETGEAAACLVVDDIPVNQKLLVFQLKHFGLTIDTASSGAEALDLIAKHNYQIVFMDCDMPRMSGYDTTAEIRRREQATGFKLPIIGMTSHDRDGDKQKCLRSGMNDALPKGVSEGELRKTIATALGVNESGKPTEGSENERNFEPQELEELISTFLYAMEMFVSSMQRAIDEKDSSLVRELASSVSGPSRVLGLHDMNKVSQEMVRLSSSGDWPQVRLKYLKLKTVYMRCQEDLRKLCPQAFSQVSATH